MYCSVTLKAHSLCWMESVMVRLSFFGADWGVRNCRLQAGYSSFVAPTPEWDTNGAHSLCRFLTELTELFVYQKA